MNLYPFDGGLIGPMMSTHITEKVVPINGNFTMGALETVPFETFLWHRSHDATDGKRKGI